jgi:hypothetical protein
MVDLCPKCSDSIAIPPCIRCDSKNVGRRGIVMNSNSKAKYRYACKDCHRVWRVDFNRSYGKEYLTVFYNFPEALEYAKKMDGTIFVKVAVSSYDKPASVYAVLNKDYTVHR